MMSFGRSKCDESRVTLDPPLNSSSQFEATDIVDEQHVELGDAIKRCRAWSYVTEARKKEATANAHAHDVIHEKLAAALATPATKQQFERVRALARVKKPDMGTLHAMLTVCGSIDEVLAQAVDLPRIEGFAPLAAAVGAGDEAEARRFSITQANYAPVCALADQRRDRMEKGVNKGRLAQPCLRVHEVRGRECTQLLGQFGVSKYLICR